MEFNELNIKHIKEIPKDTQISITTIKLTPKIKQILAVKSPEDTIGNLLALLFKTSPETVYISAAARFIGTLMREGNVNIVVRLVSAMVADLMTSPEKEIYFLLTTETSAGTLKQYFKFINSE